mmetsp:Transcript_15287/g.40381  ORF Transcript_15287/g.40381 Transcript_15287/m.40381 type:complete len:203 (+) Transcript_15287:2121-2729(+)
MLTAVPRRASQLFQLTRLAEVIQPKWSTIGHRTSASVSGGSARPPGRERSARCAVPRPAAVAARSAAGIQSIFGPHTLGRNAPHQSTCAAVPAHHPGATARPTCARVGADASAAALLPSAPAVRASIMKNSPMKIGPLVVRVVWVVRVVRVVWVVGLVKWSTNTHYTTDHMAKAQPDGANRLAVSAVASFASLARSADDWPS